MRLNACLLPLLLALCYTATSAHAGAPPASTIEVPPGAKERRFHGTLGPRTSEMGPRVIAVVKIPTPNSKKAADNEKVHPLIGNGALGAEIKAMAKRGAKVNVVGFETPEGVIVARINEPGGPPIGTKAGAKKK